MNECDFNKANEVLLVYEAGSFKKWAFWRKNIGPFSGSQCYDKKTPRQTVQFGFV